MAIAAAVIFLQHFRQATKQYTTVERYFTSSCFRFILVLLFCFVFGCFPMRTREMFNIWYIILILCHDLLNLFLNFFFPFLFVRTPMPSLWLVVSWLFLIQLARLAYSPLLIKQVLFCWMWIAMSAVVVDGSLPVFLDLRV